MFFIVNRKWLILATKYICYGRLVEIYLHYCEPLSRTLDNHRNNISFYRFTIYIATIFKKHLVLWSPTQKADIQQLSTIAVYQVTEWEPRKLVHCTLALHAVLSVAVYCVECADGIVPVVLYIVCGHGRTVDSIEHTGVYMNSDWVSGQHLYYPTTEHTPR